MQLPVRAATKNVSLFCFSAMGYEIFMDSNADAEGNYTLLSLRSDGSGGKSAKKGTWSQQERTRPQPRT